MDLNGSPRVKRQETPISCPSPNDRAGRELDVVAKPLIQYKVLTAVRVLAASSFPDVPFSVHPCRDIVFTVGTVPQGKKSENFRSLQLVPQLNAYT
jgi:hypothetical protein